MTDSTQADSSADACPLPGAAEAPADDEMAQLLAHATSVAVVGASPKADRTSHQIAVWLIENTPYEVYLVNPKAGAAEIHGHGFYPSVEALPVTPSIVDVFRRSEHVPPVADDAIACGAGALWLQLGVINADAEAAAREAGLTFVQNRCIKIEYARLREQIEAERT